MRTRRVVAAVAVVGAALAGCTSDDGALDLSDDDAGTAAPVETEPPVEVTEDPDPPPPDADEEQLYPPLPPLEPDSDSDIPEDEQRFFLDLYEEVYAAMEVALATNSVDAAELGRLLVPDELAALEATVARRLADGTELRSPDATVEWVAVTDAQGGEAVVQDCRVSGPLTGSYDTATGEIDGGGESRARIVEFYFTPIDVDGDVSYRVAGIRSGEDPERCRA